MQLRDLYVKMVAVVVLSVAVESQAAQHFEQSDFSAEQSSTVILAKTPPMGWNSWDGYGTTINEQEFRSNAKWFAQHLKPFGWSYVTIDMEWFVTNPTAEGNSKSSQYNMDSFGRYMPPASRFP